METVVIVGGGVSGLSCLNRLIDKGVDPLLLEGGLIGSPKICGEFLAPSAVNMLQQWEMGPIQPIQRVEFFAKNKKLTVTLPQPAGALARDIAEFQLADRARKKGARIREDTPILKIIHQTSSSYIIQLRSGEQIRTKNIIVATGKFLSAPEKIPYPYFAFKLHVKKILQPHSLLMYSHPSAYFGMVPISDQDSNIACLVRTEVINKIGSCKRFFKMLVENNSNLKILFNNFDINDIQLMENQSPEFRIKNLSNWSNVYWIGDALGNPPPAMGYGFAHSVNSAVLAADFYLQNNLDQYNKIVKHSLKPKMQLGRLLHSFLLNPNLGSVFLPFFKYNSWLPPLILKKIKYNDAYL